MSRPPTDFELARWICSRSIMDDPPSWMTDEETGMEIELHRQPTKREVVMSGIAKLLETKIPSKMGDLEEDELRGIAEEITNMVATHFEVPPQKQDEPLEA